MKPHSTKEISGSATTPTILGEQDASRQVAHTKEPWRRHDMEPDAIVGLDHKAIALVYGRSRNDNIDDANLLRICGCVNACADISNPAAIKTALTNLSSIIRSYDGKELEGWEIEVARKALAALDMPVPKTQP